MDRIIIDYANILVDIKKISSGGDVYSSFTTNAAAVSRLTRYRVIALPLPQPSPAQLSSHSLESLHLHPSSAQHTRARN